MPKIIVIEGNISAGKTTLLKTNIRKIFPEAAIFIEPNSEANPWLSLFYEDPKKYIVKLQHWFMAHRLANYAKVLNEYKDHKIVFMDRCIYSDWVFVHNAYNTSIMTEESYDRFLKSREDVLKDMALPDLILYLDVKPEICHDRVINLRQEACESSIPLEYLQGLQDCYVEYLDQMKKNGVTIKSIDWNSFGSQFNNTVGTETRTNTMDTPSCEIQHELDAMLLEICNPILNDNVKLDTQKKESQGYKSLSENAITSILAAEIKSKLSKNEGCVDSDKEFVTDVKCFLGTLALEFIS